MYGQRFAHAPDFERVLFECLQDGSRTNPELVLLDLAKITDVGNRCGEGVRPVFTDAQRLRPEAQPDVLSGRQFRVRQRQKLTLPGLEPDRGPS